MDNPDRKRQQPPEGELEEANVSSLGDEIARQQAEKSRQGSEHKSAVNEALRRFAEFRDLMQARSIAPDHLYVVSHHREEQSRRRRLFGKAEIAWPHHIFTFEDDLPGWVIEEDSDIFGGHFLTVSLKLMRFGGFSEAAMTDLKTTRFVGMRREELRPCRWDVRPGRERILESKGEAGDYRVAEYGRGESGMQRLASSVQKYMAS